MLSGKSLCLNDVLCTSLHGMDKKQAFTATRNVPAVQHPVQNSLKKVAPSDSNLHKGHYDPNPSKAPFKIPKAPAVFDPQRYQEHNGSPDSTSWSFSASSIHSNGNSQRTEDPAGDASQHVNQKSAQLDHYQQRHHTHGRESGFSSQEEFSLQATRRTLDFDSDSPQNSMHDKTSAGGGVRQPPRNFQTQELLSKVQAYLGQCQSPVARKSSKNKGRIVLPDGSVEFGTPEKTGKVCLTEQEVVQCDRPDSADSMSSQPSYGEGEKTQPVTKERSQEEVDQPREPLSAQRLRPIRQKTKNAVVGLIHSFVSFQAILTYVYLFQVMILICWHAFKFECSFKNKKKNLHVLFIRWYSSCLNILWKTVIFYQKACS